MTDRLFDIFNFDAGHPMVFTRLDFWIFFLLVYAGLTLLYKKLSWRNAYLMVFSFFFYYKTGGLFVLLLFFSVLTTWLIGARIAKATQRAGAKAWLLTALFIQLSLLVYFKYAYFFADVAAQLTGRDIPVMNHFALVANNLFRFSLFDPDTILLPVGISFFTFQVITYVVDIYRKSVEPVQKFTDYAFYISFFPQLVAGPIVRASHFIPQLYNSSVLNRQQFGAALFLILKGLFKKIAIGDYLAINFIDRVFAQPDSYTGLEHVFALIAYSLQVYVDFSGYTDIAIGLSLLMGFSLSQNFNAPYKAQNVADFWRRWHISLSAFLRDYVYIPLGGNKGTALRTNINLMATMLIGGLWHGASWNFIIWGGLNGVALLVYKFWKKIRPWQPLPYQWAVAGRILFTFAFITFTRLWFRSPDAAGVTAFFTAVTTNGGWHIFPQFVQGFYTVLLILLLGFVLHWIPEMWKKQIENIYIKMPMYLQALVAVLLVFIIYQSVSAGMQPFIYFQF